MAAATVIDLPTTITTDGKKKIKKRTRSFTSHDRAAHRVVEKQRREALNQSFLVRDPSLISSAHTLEVPRSFETAPHLRINLN
jgi:hypothetical protein